MAKILEAATVLSESLWYQVHKAGKFGNDTLPWIRANSR